MGQTTKGIRNLWIVGAGLLALAGCAQGVGTVDWTQPDKIKKTDLNGTWYWRDTVTKVPPTTTFTFQGIASFPYLEKLNWVIKENRLYAYRAYELIPGTLAAGIDGGPLDAPVGAPVASYNILSHFDVQREYNPATGEQTNVISENTTDRPWSEREYMRVDWSDNIITNLNSPGLIFARTGVADTVSYNGEGASPSDPRGEFYTETDPKTHELSYFDFRAHYYVKPLECLYGFPYKFFESGQTDLDCSAADVEVTSSFYKVPKSDYIPLSFGDVDMSRFGFFRTERLTYDRNYGVTESGWVKLANRYNLWKANHDAQGNLIPIAQREPKPMVYYTNPEFPPELRPAATQIEVTWDRAFRRVVAAVRGDPAANVPSYNCNVETEADERMAVLSDPTHVNRCVDPFSKSAPPQMLYVCPTPVPKGYPAACGTPGFTPRVGDIRYSFFYWVPDVQLAGPLGLGELGADPETGEIISAGAFVYGANLDLSAALARDIVDILSGETTVQNYASGSQIDSYINNHLNPADPRTWIKNLPDSYLNQKASSVMNAPKSFLLTQLDQAQAQAMGGALGTLQGVDLQQARKQALLQTLPWAAGSPREDLVMQQLKGAPDLNSLLISVPPIAAALQTLDPASQQAWTQDFMGSMQTMFQKTQALQQRANKDNVTLAGFADDSIYGFAIELKNQYFNGLTPGTPEFDSANASILNLIRNRFLAAVTDHEGGHTFGMRHNFEGSFDSLNYFPEYWQLRKENLVDESDPNLTVGALLSMEQNTDNQRLGKMREYQYTSIMDYGAKFNTDIHGLGKYDEAAILYAYSNDDRPGYVEVFDHVPAAQASDLPLVGSDSFGSTFGAAYTFWLFRNRPAPTSPAAVEQIHYTRFPAMMGEGTTFADRVNSGIANLNQRHLVLFDDLQKTLADSDQKFGTALGTFFTGRDPTAALAALNARPVPVPYLFASDELVGYLPDCQQKDEGADYFEQGQQQMSAYVNYYWFNNYKRDRFGFNEFDVLSKVFGSYFINFPRSYQSRIFSGAPSDFIQNYLWLSVITQQFGLLTNVLSTPWYGTYSQTYTPTQGTFSNYQDMTYGSYPSSDQMGRTTVLKDAQAAQAENAHNLTAQTATNCRQNISDGAPPHGSSDDTWIAWMETLPKPLHDQIPHYYGVTASEATSWGQSLGISGAWDLNTAANRMVNIDEGDGRVSYGSYDPSLGYDFYGKSIRAGHFFDRIAAMQALSASAAQFVGVDIASQFTRFILPYYDVFPDSLTQTFSGLYLGDLTRFAPRVLFDSQGLASGFGYLPPPTSLGINLTAGAPPSSAPLIDPLVGFSDAYYASFFSMGFFQAGYNIDFQDANHIFRLSAGEQVTPGPGFEELSFTDPATGVIYAALQPIGATGTSMPPAGTMISSANSDAVVLQAAQTQYSSNTCDQRNQNSYFGALNTVQNKVNYMNIMRRLYATFGVSP